MAKFSQFRFAEVQFAEKHVTAEVRHRTYRTRSLGLFVRRSINNEVTYRVRTGNNNYGAPLGKPIQDKYPYTVSDPTASHCPDAAKSALATAVSNWKNVLTPEQKKAYNKRAGKKRFLSGYNLYVGEYVEANA